MSKRLGNAVDPFETIETYGPDATRWYMISNANPWDNLKFDIDSIRFKIEDRKILKATNSQAIEIQPEYQLMEKPSFKRRYRNIFVFKKFSFPNNKLFSIELTETQASGRALSLYINYEDLLSADTL